MEKNQKILEYRKRLDKTLASHDLVNKESIKTLVKNQLLRSSPSEPHAIYAGSIESYVERRTLDVSKFLDMLRSVSRNNSEVSQNKETSRGDWKLKQDDDEYRVMYREGPQGTPFHTLLVEGYVEGPADVCLCVSWESALYKKWWPESRIPPFKITASKCVQKVRIGEQICLVRMKVAWPLSAREVVVHYFEIEYFEEDLIIILFNSVSDLDNVDKYTHGFTSDGIPEADDIVRIDVVGGIAVQKVTSNKSYFRTIATMDVKVDFIPPSFINYVSRQLIGSGFKLYQKAVASVAKGDEDFKKALEDPLYARVREGLNQKKDIDKGLELEAFESRESTGISAGEVASENKKESAPVIDQVSHYDILEEEHERNRLDQQEFANGIQGACEPTVGQTFLNEIEEEEIEETCIDETGKIINNHLINVNAEYCHVNEEHKVLINPEVENALGILEKAIGMIRGGAFSMETWPTFVSSKQELRNFETVSTEVGSTSIDGSDCGVHLNALKIENTDRASGKVEDSLRFVDASSSIETIHNGESVSVKPNSTILNKIKENSFSSMHNGIINETTVLENMSKDNEDALDNSEKKKKPEKKHRRCCLHLLPTRA
ncbi:hypothetical protein GIB67_034347 [Kingdonia uniflora]|uniref:START domain-containing protein n=1 Tax=Kingdonia uniflora TaxID=39325 RepID=A0A7J7NRY3_9MAGN|nr:hypothetical protein GIB67_034347 [Kingdonia uniflora]